MMRMLAALRLLLLGVIVLVALGLRTGALDRRPMHADEANQAVKTGELLDGGGYRFDPTDHHGPTLYFSAVPLAWLRGEHSLATLTETTLRLVPALYGTLAVALLAGFVLIGSRRAQRFAHAALAAALLAVAPAAVYYARDYIQETLLAAFVLATVAATVRAAQTGSARWAVAAGIAAGLALATKETALIYLALAGIAAGIGIGSAQRLPPNGPRLTVFAAIAAFVTAALLYTSFGFNLRGALDALHAPVAGWHRATGPTGHEKPWWYYLQLLGWQKNGGLWWHQALFTALAILGAVVGHRRRDPLLRASALYAATLLLVLSAVPYKTPWNVIQLVPPMAVLAAGGLLAIASLRTGRLVAGAAGFLLFATLLSQTRLAAFLRSADARNPYAYVQSSPDIVRLRSLAQAAQAAHPDRPIRVIAHEYWPAPWYLRGLAHVGYWSEPPADCDGALVIAGAEEADGVRARLHGSYHERFLGLRPGYVLIVFTPDA